MTLKTRRAEKRISAFFLRISKQLCSVCSAAGPTREEDGVLPVAVVVVLLAHELELVQDVQLLPGGQLLVAHHAREAVEVKDFALGPAH